MRPRFPIVLVNIYFHQPSVNAAIHAKRFSLNDSTVRQEYLSCQSWTHGDMRCQHVAAFVMITPQPFAALSLPPPCNLPQQKPPDSVGPQKLEEYQCFWNPTPTEQRQKNVFDVTSSSRTGNFTGDIGGVGLLLLNYKFQRRIGCGGTRFLDLSN